MLYTCLSILPKLDECAELKQRNSEWNICRACDSLAYYTYREAKKTPTNYQGLTFWPSTLQAHKSRCELMVVSYGSHWLVDGLCGVTWRKFWLAPIRASWALGLSGWDWLPLTPWTSMGIWSATTCVEHRSTGVGIRTNGTSPALDYVIILGFVFIFKWLSVKGLKLVNVITGFLWIQNNALKLHYICIFLCYKAYNLV